MRTLKAIFETDLRDLPGLGVVEKLRNLLLGCPDDPVRVLAAMLFGIAQQDVTPPQKFVVQQDVLKLSGGPYLLAEAMLVREAKDPVLQQWRQANPDVVTYFETWRQP